MSGWNSFDSVGTFHTAFLISGSLVAAVLIAIGATALHYAHRWDELVALAERLRSRYLPRWRADTAMVLHNGLIEVAILGIAVLLALGYAAGQYGQRKVELVAIAHAASLAKVQDEADALRRALAERETRVTNALALRQATREAEVRHLAETAALRRELEQVQSRRAIGTERPGNRSTPRRRDRDAAARQRSDRDASRRRARGAPATPAADRRPPHGRRRKACAGR